MQATAELTEMLGAEQPALDDAVSEQRVGGATVALAACQPNARSDQRYSGSLRGSPKCCSKLRSPNHVIAETLSSASVRTISP